MQLFISEKGSEKYSVVAQVMLVASPAELRWLASFISNCADEIGHDEEWDHEHYCDRNGISLPTVAEPDFAIYKKLARNLD